MKQSFCRRFKKSVSAVLAAAMSLSAFPSIPAAAENGSVSAVGKTTYTYDDYYVEYYVTDAWSGSQNVELTVYNTGEDSILNWALKYDAQGEVSNLWNAGIYEQNDSEYVIRNVDWNFEIAPNQCVTYGYRLTGNDLSLPESFELYSKRVDVIENYDVKYNITNEWDTGVQGEIVITNYAATPLEVWTLSFDSNFAVIDLWNGRVLENNVTSYTIAAEVWTNPVQPNSSMTIGFTGTKEVGAEAVLSNFRLTQVVIGESNGTATPVDPPIEDEEIEISANAAYDEENGDVTVSWDSSKQEGMFDILMYTDGDNFASVGTVTGVSEYIYTPESDFETLYFKVVQTVGEQSAESNVVSVTNTNFSEDITISANGVYDEESGNITISWETNTDNGSFEIFMSNDGENFTSAGTVTGASEYVYTPDNDFETLYFKVVQTVDNQSGESNVVIITKDSEAIVITAKAYIDEESDGVKIEWTTSNPNGSFEIFMSEDNENFTSVGIAENANEFVYAPEKSFLTLYFKVKQTVGKKSAESNVDRVIDWNNEIDSDEDGISDLDEIYTFFTDPANPDTDGDGLPDGYEIYTLDTDPLSADTDGNGIADGDEDIDGDGLTNMTEYELGTSSRDKDSDGDGLMDGDEVHIYGTDPIKSDTDEDNVSDGDEIALGLDPNNAATNGISDNERTFAQTIPADDWLFYNINTENNPFEFSIEITAAGVALNNIDARFSRYSYSMRNDAILGNIPEFSYNENLKIDDIKINFDLDKSVINSYNDKYKDISEELAGIKRFNVFRYFEDTNMLLPIETFHDEAAGRVYAHTTETGTYCLIDMAAWLDSLGFAEYTARAERSVMTYSAEKSAGNDIDIIFILHSKRDYAEFINGELTNVISSAYSHANSVHMYFISTLGDIYMINGREYAETADECQNILRRFRGSDVGGNFSAPFKTANNLVLRKGSQRHMFMFDGYSLEDKDIGYSNSFLNNILKNDVNFGIICGSVEPNVTIYKALASNNIYEHKEGKLEFMNFILDQIEFTDVPKDEEYIITSNGLVPMPEDFGDISIKDIDKDYDGDTILDIDEINFDVTDEEGNTLITVNEDGSVTLPEFIKCSEFIEKENKKDKDEDKENICIIKSLDRFYKDTEHLVADFLDKVKIVPLRSDPTSKDGDGDGIEDIIELRSALKDDGRIDTSVKTPTNPLVTNTILNVLECDGVKFNTDIKNVEEFNEEKDDVFIKPQFALAKEHENHINSLEEGIEFAYGYLGDDTDAFYLEAFAYRDTNEKIVNELMINFNAGFPHDSLNLEIKTLSPDDVLNGVIERWSGKFEGSDYDFYNLPDLTVKVNVNKIEFNSKGTSVEKRYINYLTTGKSKSSKGKEEKDYSGHFAHVMFYDGEQPNGIGYPREKTDEGKPRTSGYINSAGDGKFGGNPYVHIYKYRNDNDVDDDGYKDKVLQSYTQIYSTCTHEFGHVFGLMDAYGLDNEVNYYMEPVPKTENKPTNSKEFEIWYQKGRKIYGTSDAGEMMHRSGEVYANDIEMILFARYTEEPQFFVPIVYILDNEGNRINCELSLAIRVDYEYRSTKSWTSTDICSEGKGKLEKGKIYVFDFKTKKYKL